MDVKLLVKKGSNQTHEIPLLCAETVVGRQKGCKLRIPSGTVSRQHCRFLFADDRLYVEDLDSSNGTFVNGVRVHGRQLVRPGDEVEIGPVVLVADYLLVEADPEEVPVEGLPVVALDGEVAVIEAEAPLDVIPLADEAPPEIPVIPLADVDEEEPLAPAILDEEISLKAGDEDLRDLLSQMQ